MQSNIFASSSAVGVEVYRLHSSFAIDAENQSKPEVSGTHARFPVDRLAWTPQMYAPKLNILC